MYILYKMRSFHVLSIIDLMLLKLSVYMPLFVEVILILISRRPQRGGDFDLLIKQATRHSTNTIIPVFSGLSREEADALCDDYLYLRTVTPCFTGDDVFLDALHNGILQPHC